jgi:hypothetical protein
VIDGNFSCYKADSPFIVSTVVFNGQIYLVVYWEHVVEVKFAGV